MFNFHGLAGGCTLLTFHLGTWLIKFAGNNRAMKRPWSGRCFSTSTCSTRRTGTTEARCPHFCSCTGPPLRSSIPWLVSNWRSSYTTWLCYSSASRGCTSTTSTPQTLPPSGSHSTSSRRSSSEASAGRWTGFSARGCPAGASIRRGTRGGTSSWASTPTTPTRSWCSAGRSSWGGSRASSTLSGCSLTWRSRSPSGSESTLHSGRTRLPSRLSLEGGVALQGGRRRTRVLVNGARRRIFYLISTWTDSVACAPSALFLCSKWTCMHTDWIDASHPPLPPPTDQASPTPPTPARFSRRNGTGWVPLEALRSLARKVGSPTGRQVADWIATWRPLPPRSTSSSTCPQFWHLHVRQLEPCAIQFS